tara:strand:- start:27 stop:185 length:159 start_codon:yes stop_codon:yes gene_type:complete
MNEDRNMISVELNENRYPSLYDIVSKSSTLKSHHSISAKKTLEKLMKRIRKK